LNKDKNGDDEDLKEINDRLEKLFQENDEIK